MNEIDEPLPTLSIAAIMILCAVLAMIVITFRLASTVPARGHPDAGPAIYQMMPAPSPAVPQ